MATATDGQQTQPELTEAQQRVLTLLGEDKSPTEIAKDMGITSQGVHGHMSRLRKRGLLPGEPAASTAGRTPARSRKRAAGNDRRVTPADAFAEVRASIDEQRKGLTARATELDQEIDDLKAEIDRRRNEKRQVEKAAKDLETFEGTLPAVS